VTLRWVLASLARASVRDTRANRLSAGCSAMRVLLSWLGATILLALARPAIAGPPFVSDDPEPTEYQHFEIYIYAFNNRTNTRENTGAETGLDFSARPSTYSDLTRELQSICGRRHQFRAEQHRACREIPLSAPRHIRSGCRRLSSRFSSQRFKHDRRQPCLIASASVGGKGLAGRMVRLRRRWLHI
jgi:hypothetical protein